MGALKSQVYDWSTLVSDICHTVGNLTGNVLAEKQHPMVESRMRRRLIELDIQDPYSYKLYWDENQTSENQFLIGLLTTHFTSFFREFAHFEWLAAHLGEIVQAAKSEGRKTLYFWSAACSNGQEVWSLCMWLHHHLPKIDATMDWEILGTDIDPKSVGVADNGVYHRRELETTPRHLWEGLWAIGKDEIKDWYKVHSTLRKHAKFKTMNLLSPDLSSSQKFDVVMCRNVLIYFDRKNQERVAKTLIAHLAPQGTLITGLSESLTEFGLPIRGVETSVYKLQSSLLAPQVAKKTMVESKSIGPVLPNPLKVFCIDDSPTVITILKKILKTTGYEVIGVASNGQEAQEKLKTLKPDVITLDLHMPVMDGPTFLKESMIASTIPVVIVSSVSRDDGQTVSPLFALGVSDFVEKPTLANMNKIGEELLQKLKMSWMTKAKKIALAAPVVATSAKAARPPGCIVFNIGELDLNSLGYALKQSGWNNDELTFVVDPKNYSNPVWMGALEKILPKCASVKMIKSTEMTLLKSKHPIIWVNYKGGSVEVVRRFKEKSHLVITEESAQLPKSLIEISDDVAPYTSISYNLCKLLGGE